MQLLLLMLMLRFKKIILTKKSYTAKGDQFGNIDLGYKVYIARLTQSGTSAPVATVIQNNTGEVLNWVRDDVGSYSVQVGSLSNIGNIHSIINGTTLNIKVNTYNFPTGLGTTSVVVQTTNAYDNSSQDINEFTYPIIEIRVYNSYE